MVLAVDEPHPHALDRVAGDGAVRHRLLDPLLDRRDEAAGDRGALDLVDELEPDAVLGRLDLDLAVGELAAPARLLLVAGVGARPGWRIDSW